MAQSSVINPVELYESVLDRTKETLANVQPGQLQGPTPCREWNVETLMDHILANTKRLTDVLSAGGTEQDLGGRDKATTFGELAGSAVRLARQPGAMEREYDTPLGRMPGSQFIMGTFMETVIHRWDLAKATGQDTAIDPKHAEAIYDSFKGQIPFMRQVGVIGPEVKVPQNATLQERLLGLLGREA